MDNIRMLLIAANPNLAVLELETRGSRPVLQQLRAVLGELAVRVVCSEGYLLEGAIRERVYVSNTNGKPLTPARVQQMYAALCRALESDRNRPLSPDSSLAVSF